MNTLELILTIAHILFTIGAVYVVYTYLRQAKIITLSDCILLPIVAFVPLFNITVIATYGHDIVIKRKGDNNE